MKSRTIKRFAVAASLAGVLFTPRFASAWYGQAPYNAAYGNGGCTQGSDGNPYTSWYLLGYYLGLQLGQGLQQDPRTGYHPGWPGDDRHHHGRHHNRHQWDN